MSLPSQLSVKIKLEAFDRVREINFDAIKRDRESSDKCEYVISALSFISLTSPMLMSFRDSIEVR